MDKLDSSWKKKKKPTQNLITTGTQVHWNTSPMDQPGPQHQCLWNISATSCPFSSFGECGYPPPRPARTGWALGGALPSQTGAHRCGSLEGEPGPGEQLSQLAARPLALRRQKLHCSPLAELSPSSADLFISKKSQGHFLKLCFMEIVSETISIILFIHGP